jgi:hypothetical protein
MLNFICFRQVKQGFSDSHNPPNAALVAEFHQQWWFSAKHGGHNQPKRACRNFPRNSPARMFWRFSEERS